MREINYSNTPVSSSEAFLEDMVSAPLLAAVEANAELAKSQIRFLLETCFNGDKNGTLHPVMIKMNVERREIKSDDPTKFIHHVLNFEVPLLSLIPLSHLAISEFSLDFSLNISEIIKSKQTDEQQGKQQKLAKNTSPSPRFLAKHTSLNQREDSKQQSDETHLQFNIKATQLPLTNGVLKLLDAFSNVISQPNNQHG